MHEQIVAFINEYGTSREPGSCVVNEGRNLLAFLEHTDESQVLEDFDVFDIFAAYGNVRVYNRRVRTFLNLCKFSSSRYIRFKHMVLDDKGNKTGVTYILTDNEINRPSLVFYNGEVTGELCIPSKYPEKRKKEIIENAKYEVRSRCKERFFEEKQKYCKW